MAEQKIIIRGNKKLAEHLGVHHQTVQAWRRKGLLAKATVAEYGRIILYDLNRVLDCLQYPPARPGRKAI